MRHYLLVYLLFFGVSAYAQPNYCDPCGDGNVGIVSKKEGEVYKANYKSVFRTDVLQRKMFSESVEFSRIEILELLRTTADPVYCGFNIYLIGGAKSNRPGHEEENQIGVALVPRKRTGIPDFSRYIPENIAFNQTGGYGGLQGVRRSISDTDLVKKRDSFKLRYPNSSEKLYTRYVLIGEETRNFLLDFVDADINEVYKTYRFYFISYKKRGVVCEQGHQNQISVMIVPVDNEGPKFEAFDKFYALSKFKNKKKSLNHGSLCPNYCPDGDL